MNAFLAQTLRSRWLTTLVHAALWLLLYLAVIGIGGKAPPYSERDATFPPPHSPEPIAKLDRLFTMDYQQSGLTNQDSPFFTQHFVPAPKPAPPPPTTKKIELVYLGFYAAQGGMPQTMVKLGDKYLITPLGSNVTANLYAAQASVLSLLLTNSTGQTNLLRVNVKKEVEVPLK